MRRIGLAVVLSLSFVLAPGAFGTQQTGKIPRIGVLSPQKSTEPASTQREPFERGLRELGWTPSSNVIIEYRFAEGKVERLPELAAEFIRLGVAVIVTRGTAATRAARQATGTTPIVMSAVDEPARHGFIASLSRPGGNITGLAFLAEGDLEGKRLELLKETIPGLVRVAYVVNPDSRPDPGGSRMRAADLAAQSLRLELQVFKVSKPEHIPEAFAAIGRARVGALLFASDIAVLDPNLSQVVALTAKYRLAAIHPWPYYVTAGGLMSYGPIPAAFHYRSATFVDKILKGAKPGDLPVEQPTKFELVINLKTAKALGLTIPQSLLVRADEIIQ
jgi:putative ABC transport system substrate-binding protein